MNVELFGNVFFSVHLGSLQVNESGENFWAGCDELNKADGCGCVDRLCPGIPSGCCSRAFDCESVVLFRVSTKLGAFLHPIVAYGSIVEYCIK